MSERDNLQRVLSGIIADTFDENAHIDSNRPDITDTIWTTAVRIADLIETAFSEEEAIGEAILKKDDCNADCYKCDISGHTTIKTVKRLRERIENG